METSFKQTYFKNGGECELRVLRKYGCIPVEVNEDDGAYS
jgi:hypothetical protein